MKEKKYENERGMIPLERYYQPEIETASREQIKAWQDERLVKQVKHVWDNVPYYRKKMEEKGVTPADIKGRDDLHNQQRRAVDRRSDCRKDDDYVENFKRYGQRRVRLPQLAEGVVIVVKPAQSGKLHYNVDNIGKYAHGYKRKYYGRPAVVYEVAQDLVAGCEARADVGAKPNRGN